MSCRVCDRIYRVLAPCGEHTDESMCPIGWSSALGPMACVCRRSHVWWSLRGLVCPLVRGVVAGGRLVCSHQVSLVQYLCIPMRQQRCGMASQLALVGCARGHGRPRAVACSVRLSRAVRVRQHARHRGVPYRCMVLPARVCGRLSACACLRSIDGRRSVDCQRACVCGRLSACLCGARSRSVSHPCVCRRAWACVVSLLVDLFCVP